MIYFQYIMEQSWLLLWMGYSGHAVCVCVCVCSHLCELYVLYAQCPCVRQDVCYVCV